jgi:hypothetical protein
MTAADDSAGVDDAHKRVIKGLNVSGSITASFEWKGKGKVSYSNRQHTKTETRTELVRWVAESLRPFKIVSDQGFQSPMKTGWPHYDLPLPSTVSCDIKTVFAQTHKRIVKLLQVCHDQFQFVWPNNMAHKLQEHDGKLNFATDCWTSPNHCAFMAMTV